MAKRKSGNVSVRLTFDGTHDAYVCHVSAPGEKTRRILVGYRHLVHSVYSSESYDTTAREAIIRAGMLGYATIDYTGSAILTRTR